MKAKIIIVTLMIMLSMLTISTASTDNFTLEDTYDGVALNVDVECDGTNFDIFGVGIHNGEYEMEGDAVYEEKEYTADLSATGFIMEGIWKPSRPFIVSVDIDGRLYQDSDTGYLYKDEDNKYYGYYESGYTVDGRIIKPDWRRRTDLGLVWYSERIVTHSKIRDKFMLSSPPLGLGYHGSVAGDYIPPLFTYRDAVTGERIVSETYPEPWEHMGIVICTPARIAGEPLVPNGFWDTAKGQRILDWKANS